MFRSVLALLMMVLAAPACAGSRFSAALMAAFRAVALAAALMAATLTTMGSDSLLVHAPGTARPMTSWHLAPVCCSKGDENISVMVTHAKPKRRERPTGRRGLDGHGGQPAADFLSGMRYAVKIASQRLLANASGSVRSGSTGHH